MFCFLCPQCEVIFQPLWWNKLCCKTTQRHTLPDGFEEQVVSDKTTDTSLQNAVFPPTTVTLAPPNNTRQSLLLQQLVVQHHVYCQIVLSLTYMYVTLYPLTFLPCAHCSALGKGLQKSFDVLTPQTFVKAISNIVKTECGRFMPTFPPGKIYHLKVTKNSKPWYVYSYSSHKQ